MIEATNIGEADATKYDTSWCPVWDFLHDISLMSSKEFEELFSCKNVEALVTLLDYPTAKDRYEAYKEKFCLKPGDVVVNNAGTRGTILKDRDENSRYAVLLDTLAIQHWTPMQVDKKIGSIGDKLDALLTGMKEI